LIAEAVKSYRAGAFRSAIVATWIAVCFDIMEKIRELALAGDANAKAKEEELERIRSAGDISAALAIEKRLLKMAKDEFEFLSPLQLVDLERLYEDRNRCAHPSLVAEEEHYAPSAELARMHIYNAVEHLLRHPPAQGKFAFDRVMATISSEFFPVRIELAVAVLKGTPLGKPKDSLVRNVVVVLIKELLGDLPPGHHARAISALSAIQSMHPQIYDVTLVSKLSALARAVEDDDLPQVILLLRGIPSAWEALEHDVVTRLEEFVKNIPKDHLEVAAALENFHPLAAAARSRISRATRAEISEAMFFVLGTAVADRVVDLYLQSTSFERANATSSLITDFSSDFSQEQIERLLRNIANNKEITGSFRLPVVIRVLRNEKRLAPEQFETLLKENGLEEYALEEFVEDDPF